MNTIPEPRPFAPLICFGAAVLLSSSPLRPQDQGGAPIPPESQRTLELEQRWLEGAMEGHRSAFGPLNENYRNALKRLLEAQSAAGRLETAVQVQQEIERFGSGAEVDEALMRQRMEDSFPDLRRLQATYLNERARIANSQRQGVAEVLREYERRLAQLQTDLTRNRELEAALKVSEEREKLRDHPVLAEMDAAAARTGPVLEGVLSFLVKGEAELYHNGRKVSARNHSDHRLFVAAQTQPRVFRSGDHIVLHTRTPYVNRGAVLGIKARDGDGEIAVKIEHWRVMPTGTDPAKVTAEEIRSSRNTVDRGVYDIVGKPLWESFGLTQHDDGGSEWIQTAERAAWVTYGFVLSPDMFPRSR